MVTLPRDTEAIEREALACPVLQSCSAERHPEKPHRRPTLLLTSFVEDILLLSAKPIYPPSNNVSPGPTPTPDTFLSADGPRGR